MNSLICLLTLIHFFKLTESRLKITRFSRMLIYVGVLLPLGDYVIRLILGDFWFFSGKLIFHSYLYQGIFWGVLALLHWVSHRDVRRSLRYLLPLAGFTCYLFFGLISTEHLAFFSPISNYSINIGLMNSGFFVPTIVALLLWGTKKWSDFSAVTISRISLIVLVLLFVQSAVIQNRARGNLTSELREAQPIRIAASDLLMTEWNVVGSIDGVYKTGRYHFVQGFRGKIEEPEANLHDDAIQNALLSPSIRNLFLFGFKNPVMTVEVQNEVSKVTISELMPLVDLLWIDRAELTRNRSGQVIDYSITYGSIF